MHLSGSIGKTRQGRDMPRQCVGLIVAGAANAAGLDKGRNRPLCDVSGATRFEVLKALRVKLGRRTAGTEQIMNEEDFQAFLAALKKFNAEHSTPEAARKVLQEEGVLDENGELAEFYRREQPVGK
jgi:hypothetical protein